MTNKKENKCNPESATLNLQPTAGGLVKKKKNKQKKFHQIPAPQISWGRIRPTSKKKFKFF
jgi:hypothetical protein